MLLLISFKHLYPRRAKKIYSPAHFCSLFCETFQRPPLHEWYAPLPCRSPLLYLVPPSRTDAKPPSYTPAVKLHKKDASSRDGHSKRNRENSEKTLPNCAQTLVEQKASQITSPLPVHSSECVSFVLSQHHYYYYNNWTRLCFFPPSSFLPPPSSSSPSSWRNPPQSDEFTEKRRRR